MNIDITDAEIVKLIIQDIESPQNKERKRQEWEAYQCTEGLMRNYVMKRVQELYPKNWKKMRISDVSLSKKINDKVSKAYSQNPVRSLDQEVSDETKDMLADIYKEGCFNSAYREFDSSFNLHRYSNFWVNYDMEAGKYRPQNLRPYEYDLVRDPNSGDVLCVILNYPDLEVTRQNLYFGADLAVTDGVNQLIAESQVDSGSESKVYALWTDTQHAVVVVTKKVVNDMSGRPTSQISFAITYVPLKDNPNSVNPLGKLPFVYKQKGASTDYPFHNQITEQSINYNLMMSDLITAASMQGFGQAILSYPENAEIKEVEVGLMAAVRLPQSTKLDAPKTEFKFESPSPDLAGQKTICDNYMYSVLAEHGIDGGQSNDKGSTTFTSAADRYMASADVQWIVKENQEVYQELEEEVFEIIKLWEGLNGNNAFDKAEELKVYFPQPTINITESDKLKNIEMLLKLRLKTRPQALMILDPNLTEQQAEDEIQEVDDESLNSMKTFRSQIADSSKPDSTNNFGKQGSGPVASNSDNGDASVGDQGPESLN